MPFPRINTPGSLTISRASSSHGPDYIVVQIWINGDMVKATVGLAAFASAVTGFAHQECVVECRPAPANDRRAGPSSPDETVI